MLNNMKNRVFHCLLVLSCSSVPLEAAAESVPIAQALEALAARRRGLDPSIHSHAMRAC